MPSSSECVRCGENIGWREKGRIVRDESYIPTPGLTIGGMGEHLEQGEPVDILCSTCGRKRDEFLNGELVDNESDTEGFDLDHAVELFNDGVLSRSELLKQVRGVDGVAVGDPGDGSHVLGFRSPGGPLYYIPSLSENKNQDPDMDHVDADRLPAGRNY